MKVIEIGGLHIEVAPFTKIGIENYIYRISFNGESSIFVNCNHAYKIVEAIRGAYSIEIQNVYEIDINDFPDKFKPFHLAVYTNEPGIVIEFKFNNELNRNKFQYDCTDSSCKSINKDIKEVENLLNYIRKTGNKAFTR